MNIRVTYQTTIFIDWTLNPGAGATHVPHVPHDLHIGTYKFRLRTGYTKLFVRNKLQVRAVHDRA